jgi:diguanylate cyclase (GGDEF)-like protein/PAS domain S-box-containing protein
VLGINDVTEAVSSIANATRQALTVGIVGWLMLELLLMGILWAPMSRLRRTALNLPLLAEGAFATVRRAIADHAAQGGFRDEIDALDNTAIELSVQLEQLENQVADRNRALSRRMEELARERDFVQSLLDTAQVLILTQDRGGRVLMVNSHGESMSGYAQGELSGHSFEELLAPDGSVPDLSRHLGELCAGRRNSLRHESVLRCRDGSVRTVTWFHSRLTSRGDDSAAVLSVGLDVTERKEAEHRLSWLHDHDALTGLANRSAFQKELAARMESRGWRGALIVLDLDQFKYVNDTSGHHAGDALLKLVAGQLQGQVGEAELICRLGGDEFAMLVADADRELAGQIAGKVNRLLGEIEWPADRPVPRVTASLGIALVPDHGSSVGDLMACADLAVFQAKESGRGHWHVFAEHDRAIERFKRNVFWKSKVEQALASDDFVLYFQPISRIHDANVSHYEVLLRVRQDGGVAAPGAFIEAAERSGLIHLVDRRVLSRALEQLSELVAQGWNLSFSINLSAHGLNDPELLPHLEAEIRRTGVDPGRVILEITETAAVSDFAAARRVMAAIKSLGCHFALDDFGVGFSSFYYLKQLPIDYVKIDGSFITQLAENIDDQILVQALTQVAKGFGKLTIAEFVENAETLALLRDFGIDYAQGHYIGMPQPDSALFAAPVADRAVRPGKGR